MALKTYKSGGTDIWFKIIKGQAHESFRSAASNKQLVPLGIAFRTREAPIGYLPFFSTKDFDLSGETSFKEEVLSRLPLDLSSPASPHTLLIAAAQADVEFAGSGEDELPDILEALKNDRLRHAMRAASGVLVDGVMLALGGPAIKTLVGQLTQSTVKQFILSRAITSAAKNHLKSQGNFDVDKFLSAVP